MATQVPHDASSLLQLQQVLLEVLLQVLLQQAQLQHQTLLPHPAPCAAADFPHVPPCAATDVPHVAPCAATYVPHVPQRLREAVLRAQAQKQMVLEVVLVLTPVLDDRWIEAELHGLASGSASSSSLTSLTSTKCSARGALLLLLFLLLLRRECLKLVISKAFYCTSF